MFWQKSRLFYNLMCYKGLNWWIISVQSFVKPQTLVLLAVTPPLPVKPVILKPPSFFFGKLIFPPQTGFTLLLPKYDPNQLMNLATVFLITITHESYNFTLYCQPVLGNTREKIIKYASNGQHKCHIHFNIELEARSYIWGGSFQVRNFGRRYKATVALCSSKVRELWPNIKIPSAP